MATGKMKYRVLVASAGSKGYEFVAGILPKTDYEMLGCVSTVGEARRMLMDVPVDLVVINAPLKDEFGLQLAVDMAADQIGVLVMVNADIFDQVCYKVEDAGVLVMEKPFSHKGFYAAIKLLTAMRAKLIAMEKRVQTVENKMADIRTVNRAKWLLIERCGMTESDAHYYIEKQAMDTRLSRREVAEGIIRTYEL